VLVGWSFDSHAAIIELIGIANEAVKKPVFFQFINCY
jgi:hypothetical protein